MAGIVHGGGLTAAIGRYGGTREDWLDLSTGINPNMPELPEMPVEVWNRLPDRGLVDEARAAAREFYLGASVESSVRWPEISAQALPPSVLPDISPSRGEIDSRRPSRANAIVAEDAALEEGKAAPQPLSPLVGEMSGRTEGGKTAAEIGAVEKTRTTSDLPLAIPGTQSLIQILPRLVQRDRLVGIVSPTYGEYHHCFERAGFNVDHLASADDLRPDHGTLVVVNPNNPNGLAHAPQTLLLLHKMLRSRGGGHLHVDEAFGDTRPELSIAREASVLPGLTVSRSFGKFFGMAGLRLGFVFAEPSLLERIEAELGPWAVSGPALYIAREWMRTDRAKILDRILERKASLDAVLKTAGLRLAGGTELFALVEHQDAGLLFEHLARSHILVRKFDYRPDWLRIGLAGDEQGDRRLAAALASFRR
jgi:cobalamin biosynthetic protein CobC